jgi:GNAT superfamily N-acetyltransferase
VAARGAERRAMQDSIGLAPLADGALPRAAGLSALIGWNQTAADWRLFQRHGRVRALDDGDPRALAATAATLPYGAGVAWISMVLVRPDMRRLGLATALLRWAVESLRAAALPCIALDATPAGREVYRRLGFRDLWGFARWALPPSLPAEPGVAVRPLRAGDWPALLAMDGAAFGAPRGFLLRDFAARLPAAALVAEAPGGGGIAGALLARDGVLGPQLGPLHAAEAATARALLAAGLAALPPGGRPAVVDVRDGALGVAGWLAAHGAVVQRPFTRMALGAADPPGDPARMAAVAGPEFG